MLGKASLVYQHQMLLREAGGLREGEGLWKEGWAPLSVVPGSTGQALLNPPPHSALISPGVQQVQPILPKAFVHSQLSRSCQEDSLLPAQPVPGAGVAAELPRGHRGRFLTGLHRGCRGRNSLQPEPREPGSVHTVPRSSNTLKNLHENQNPSEPKFSSSSSSPGLCSYKPITALSQC